MRYLGTRLLDRFSKQPIVAVTLAMVLTLLLFVPLGLNAWKAYRIFNQVIVTDFQLQRLAGTIVYLDEALTMSARLNAATGDTQWEERYQSLEPKLDAAIKQTIQLAPDAYEAAGANATDAANLKLVEMEYQSFNLVRQGKPVEAAALLSGQIYESQKAIYADGMQRTTAAIATRIQANKTTFSQDLLLSSAISGLSLVILLPIWSIILRLLNKYLVDAKTARRNLQHLNEELELRVEQRTSELTQALNELQQMQLKVVQTEKMSALGNLVAGVAHEINNPVGCIVGNLAAMQTSINDLFNVIDLYSQQFPHPGAALQVELAAIDLPYLRQDLPKLIRAMQDGSDRIKSISQSLRTFSRADSDHKQLFILHEGIDSTLLILRHRLQANDQRPAIEVVTDYGDLPAFSCFPGQLNQVFMNILANAIDALEESNQGRNYSDIEANPNQITIQTRLHNNQIHVTIADNGCGMPENIRNHIFDYLFTTKGINKGTGLGLAIARQIVEEKHGGNLEVQSEVGQGTEFYIQLPISIE